MKGFFSLFKRSALEFKSIRCLTATAMLIALDLALKLTAGIVITDYLHISFAFVALASISMLFGPTVGFAAGLITDILGFLIKPSGAFDIRYTFIEALGALIYGIFLYNAQNDRWLVPRVIAAKASVVIICNLWLTTWVSASYYGKGFFALLPARAIKNIAQLPLDILLLSLLLPVVLKIWKMIPGTKRHIDEKLLFADENVGKAMITLMALVMIIVCSLGISSQSLKDQQTEMNKTVKEHGEQIEKMDAEIQALYDELGLERRQTADTE